jgi:hypothetical protein
MMNDSTPIHAGQAAHLRRSSGAWATTATAVAASPEESTAAHPSDAPPPSSVALRTTAPLEFELLGETSLVIPTLRSQVSSAEGVAWRADSSSLEVSLAGPHSSSRQVTLSHNLPSSIDLHPLLGQTLRVTLIDDVTPSGCASQTLTISGVGGRVWLVARFGPVPGLVHSIGGTEVRAALSQRQSGPLVVGTDRLQWLVYAGCHVRLGDAAQGLVVEHIARPSTESSAYVIAESRLYRG